MCVCVCVCVRVYACVCTCVCVYVDFKVGRELGYLWGLGLCKWVKDWVILNYWDCVSGSKRGLEGSYVGAM